MDDRTVVCYKERSRRVYPLIMIRLLLNALWSASVLTGVACAVSTEATSVEPQSVAPTLRTAQDARALVRWSRVVHLETPQSQLMGRVGRVLLRESDSHVFVSDPDVTRSVYEFTIAGAFVRRFNSGSLRPIRDMALFPDGRLLVARDNVLEIYRHQQSPDAISMTPFSVVALEVAHTGQVCAHTSGPTSLVPSRLVCLNDELSVASHASPFEMLFARYPFGPTIPFALIDAQLAAVSFEEPRVDIYDTNGRLNKAFRFDGQSVWDAAGLNRTDRGDLTSEQRLNVRRNVHRFRSVQNVGARLMLWEQHEASALQNVVFLDLEGQATAYKGLGPHMLADTAATGLSLSSIAGVWSGGIIGVLGTEGSVAKYGRFYPQLVAPEVTAQTNPLLVFLEVGDPR